MPIFRYTFKKMLLTPSTWIILVMTVAFLALFNSLPLTSLGSDVISYFSAEGVLIFYLPIWKMLVFQIFLGLMLFIFIAVKATQVFRDEIDDGTLLILVSKPVSRTKIWTEKLLSLQTMILLFIFLSIFISGIFIAIPGIGSGASYSKMFPYMWILFGVGIIFDLIVSSIPILLSLVMNAKAIIAIMIGFAALLQILSSSLIMNQIAAPTNEYMQASQAAAVYSTAKSKLNASDLTWLDSYIADGTTNTKKLITDDLTAIYT
ncbi:ABC transporter permease subunit [Spiroplasma endosymbiont of Virgichneumon dumeticola]|uniref:ABC transporter permease subunit n=1 Tax=Spiroplasma endosymbiont of Virgichneumon dumeticola TaxID=3139323 RepID=UPI0035C8E1B3